MRHVGGEFVQVRGVMRVDVVLRELIREKDALSGFQRVLIGHADRGFAFAGKIGIFRDSYHRDDSDQHDNEYELDERKSALVSRSCPAFRNSTIFDRFQDAILADEFIPIIYGNEPENSKKQLICERNDLFNKICNNRTRESGGGRE